MRRALEQKRASSRPATASEQHIYTVITGTSTLSVHLGNAVQYIQIQALFSWFQNFKTLQDFLSHQIFLRMHEVLNVVK